MKPIELYKIIEQLTEKNPELTLPQLYQEFARLYPLEQPSVGFKQFTNFVNDVTD